MKMNYPRIEEILPQSIAEKHNIKKNEIIKSINGCDLRDIIDFQYLTANEELELVVQDGVGKLRSISIKKDFEDDLGIGFESAVFDGISKCKNHCIFCFVDQMPKGHRKTLYVKDDDYRLSFLYGNYVTLTNLTDDDFKRIEGQSLSPLYISIHCVDPEMRAEILGINEEVSILDNLHRLAANNIKFHGQIVLVPGYNDGKYLIETIEKVAAIGDSVLSLALVPVGLTKCQKNNLRTYTESEAKAIIELSENWQAKFLKERGANMLYVADEFYLLAGREVPTDEAYEDYPQIENGVGIIRQFYEDFDYCYEDFPQNLVVDNKIIIVTGQDGAKALNPKIDKLKMANINIKTLAVKNTFFGDSVTVTGLLTGGDIINAIKNYEEDNCIFLIPDIVLKHNTDLLLDDTCLTDFEKITNGKVKIIETSASVLLNTITEIGKEQA